MPDTEDPLACTLLNCCVVSRGAPDVSCLSRRQSYFSCTWMLHGASEACYSTKAHSSNEKHLSQSAHFHTSSFLVIALFRRKPVFKKTILRESAQLTTMPKLAAVHEGRIVKGFKIKRGQRISEKTQCLMTTDQIIK